MKRLLLPLVLVTVLVGSAGQAKAQFGIGPALGAAGSAGGGGGGIGFVPIVPLIYMSAEPVGNAIDAFLDRLSVRFPALRKRDGFIGTARTTQNREYYQGGSLPQYVTGQPGTRRTAYDSGYYAGEFSVTDQSSRSGNGPSFNQTSSGGGDGFLARAANRIRSRRR